MSKSKKTLTITAAQLEALKACGSQVALFREMFGESVSFASIKEAKQKAIELGNKFDWEWAASHMLKSAAWEGYAKAVGAARKRYEKVRGAAREEYAKVRGAAWEEYEKVKGAAWEEYAKVKGAAFAEALWKSGIGKRSGPRQAR